MVDDKKSVADMVQASKLGQDLEPSACEVLSSIIGVCELADNEVLFEEGDSDSQIFILVEGRLAVTKGGDATQTILHVLEQGDLAGEMAFIDQTPHAATLKSLGDATVLCLEREKFESLIESHPRVVYHIMRTIVRCVHTTLRRMNTQYIEMSNYITKAHGRY